MMRLMLLMGAIFFCLRGNGQPVHSPVQNDYISAGAYSFHFKDAFSFLSNPAGLGTFSTFSLGILAERKWNLQELDQYQAAISFPAANGGIGVGMQYGGDADYNESAFAMSYGKHLGRLDIGACFNYFNARASGYSAVGFGSTGIGMLINVSDKLVVGWDLSLPVFGRSGKTNPERGPQYFQMGFGYEWLQDLLLSLRIVKAGGLPADIICSLEYRYGDQFFFSFGISAPAGSVYFKSGWRKRQTGIAISTLYEPVLGFSPAIMLTWESKNKKG